MTPTDTKRAKHRDWMRNYRRQLAYGRWTPKHVDPTPARNHITTLREYSLSNAAIGHLAGLSTGQIEQLMNPGHHQYRNHITQTTEQRILATRFDLNNLLHHHQIHACGTKRRIRALNRLGWSQSYLATRLGITPAAVNCYLHPSRKRVNVSVALKIRDLYDELSMTPGPDTKSAGRATRRGWPPPLAWDDDTIDHPNAQPHTNTQPTDPIDAETLHDLARWGHDLTAATQRLTLTAGAIEHWCSRHDRIDLLNALNTNGPDPVTCPCGRIFPTPASHNSHRPKCTTTRKDNAA